MIFTPRPRAALGADMSAEIEEAEMANKEACSEAFVEWFEANKAFIEDRGTFANVRALVSMGFKAGWVAAQAADVWE